MSTLQASSHSASLSRSKAPETQDLASPERRIAEEILSIARSQLLVQYRFLSRALHELKPLAVEEPPLASDGRHLLYEPRFLLLQYRDSRTFALRAVAHVLMHSLFRHMFVERKINRGLWDLASDIAAESMIHELRIRQLQEEPGAAEMEKALQELQKAVPVITAERLYRYFLQHPLSEAEEQRLRGLFTLDDHTCWYPPEQPKNAASAPEEKNSDAAKRNKAGDDAPQSPASPGSPEEPNPGAMGGDTETESPHRSTEKGSSGSASLAQMWREISEQVQTDLETFSRKQGISAGTMEQALRSLNREKYDYADFLRKFAAFREVMRLSEDEFDYVYYTYGLRIYRDMPLIEPLEYREDKRIRDFVIALDTSGSVQGRIVQCFLQKTWNILKQTDAFDTHFRLHLIQCDAAIQEDAIIHSQQEFDDYIAQMRLRGFGGTDFRPVFEYVEQLRSRGQLPFLKGLLYFTDGFGTYPVKPTDYKTAFLFLDQNAEGRRLVPPWAMQVVLEAKDLDLEESEEVIS